MNQPSDAPDKKTPGKPETDLASSTLPPVEPPSIGFILQLFVIPLVIVTIIVLVWLLFSWLAHMGSNPQELVRDLKKLNDASWQKALTLADLLRNPEHDHLKRDVNTARELAGVLESQMETGSMDEAPVKLRMFLCRALGEFRVSDVLPVLLRAAAQERDPVEIDVRRTALEALAVFAMNNQPEQLRSNRELMNVLQTSSRERSQRSEDQEQRAELRSAAAFVLGVIGGEEALDRLDLLMGDAYANTRYNAALGLARHGDARAVPVLLEMLDPKNQKSTEDESHESGKVAKRLLVLKNGIRGASQLAEKNATDDLDQLAQSLENVIQSDLELFDYRARRGIRINAEDALIVLKSRERRPPVP